MSKCRWTDEEINTLVSLAPKCYIREIAQVLNRTEGAVITKANKMGLDYIILKREYTQDELDYIKSGWGKVPVIEMARVLKVSRIMVQKQAELMNLPKLGNNPYRKWTKKKIGKLKKLSQEKTITELAQIFKTTKEAIQTVATRNSILLIDEKIHWTEEDNIKLRELAKTMDISEIATIMNRTTSAVRLQAKRQNIELMGNKKARDSIWTEDNNKQLIELVNQGKTLLEIVVIMNKKDQTLLKKAKELGIEIKRDKDRPWNDDDIEKLRLLSTKFKLSELVKELNRTSSSIKSQAKKHNIKIISDRKNWTEEEYKKLEELAIVEKKTPKEIADILGRTEDSIIIKINRIGLQIQTNDKRFWTKEEEDLLSELWGIKSVEYIAQKLNRTVSSVKNKCFQLDLGSSIENNYDGLIISDICELFNVDRNTVSNYWVSLGLIVDTRKISKAKSYMYVTIPNLFDFLEKNQNIWDSRCLERNILGIEPEWLLEKRKRDYKESGDCSRLNLTKQQLILARKFFLELEQSTIIEQSQQILEVEKGPQKVKKCD